MVAECRSTWLRTSNVRVTVGGFLSGSSRDEEACLAECLSNSACVFVDYAPSSQRCYVHTDANDLSQLTTDTDFQQYILVRRCAASDRKYA